MPGGGGAARRADRRRADPDRLPVHRARLAAGLLPGDPGRRARAGSRTGWRGAMQSVADAFADVDRRSSPRTGTCSAGSGPTCRPTRRPADYRLGAPDAHRTGLPLPVGRPRRGPVPRPRPGPDAARPGPPRRGPHAGRARGVPHRRVDHLRRAHRPDARTTARWPAVQFGPVSAARVRRWLRDGHFDVVHVHEPAPPSVSLLVCMIAKGPIVATFHAATTRSKLLAAWGPVVRPWLERISGRIAVSDFARRVQVEHLGGDAVIIPNGVHVVGVRRGAVAARASPAASTARRSASSAASTSRARACRCCWRPCAPSSAGIPGARLLVAGRGDADAVRELIGEDLRASVSLLGELQRGGQGRVPALGRHLLRAQPAGGVLRRRAHRGAGRRGAPIVASDLDAFARVLEDGAAGVLVRRGDPAALGGGAVRAAGRPGPAGRALGRRRPASRPPTTGTCWPGGSSPSTRRSLPARGRRGDRGGGRRDLPGRAAGEDRRRVRPAGGPAQH